MKDEIDIQIDLLSDPDWVVRREAIITLGEMGDERCVEPLARALRDGDWQVREVAIEGLGQVGSPAVETRLSNCSVTGRFANTPLRRSGKSVTSGCSIP